MTPRIKSTIPYQLSQPGTPEWSHFQCHPCSTEASEDPSLSQMSKAPSHQVFKQKRSTWHAHSNQTLKPIKREVHSGFHPFSKEVIHIPPLHMSTAYHTVFAVNYLWTYATGQSQCGVNSPTKRVPAMLSVSQDSMLCKILNMRWDILPKKRFCP